MSRATGLLASLCAPGELATVAQRCARGKRRQSDVAWFLFDEARQVATLRDALTTATWRPAPLAALVVRDPKPRVIARSPFEDRVVHLALARRLEAVYGPSLSPSDFACRPGWGQHRAVLALQRHLRCNTWAVHLDVRAYFPSIDPGRIASLLGERIADAPFLDLVGHMLAQGPAFYAEPSVRAAGGLTPEWPPPGRGLAIGSSLSQHLAAHVYLNAFDHWIKRRLRVPGYVRYVDDIFLFGRGRAEVRAWREAVGEWLAVNRGLRLKAPDAPVIACAATLHGLGYRISREARAPRVRTLRRLRQRVAEEMRGGGAVDAARSLASSAGLWVF
ncbi:reverse transcriptase/maturase family protein [Myxococcota bacterium]|nr:reverse transcriptase/maturase family protein [Myxococcota bacterium]